MENNIIYHHGIKGMKWGVRRFQNKDGSRTVAGKKREKMISADEQERSNRKSEVKNRRIISSDDLRKKIERLKLEKEYKNLIKDDIAPGRKFVSEALTSGAKKAIPVMVAGTIAYAVKVAMTKEFDIKEAANYIAANPNKKK